MLEAVERAHSKQRGWKLPPHLERRRHRHRSPRGVSCRVKQASVIAVVDASVAIKWFLFFKPDEDHADLALKFWKKRCRVRSNWSSPHFIAEVAAVLARTKPDEARDDC